MAIYRNDPDLHLLKNFKIHYKIAKILKLQILILELIKANKVNLKNVPNINTTRMYTLFGQSKIKLHEILLPPCCRGSKLSRIQ